MIYTWKQKGQEVIDLQNALMRKGYALPRYGADGDLGGETWGKVEAFAQTDQFSTSKPLPESVTDRILAATTPAPTFDLPAGHVRVVGDPADVHGVRSWSAINSIVIHQTGCWMNDTPDRFKTLNAHIGLLANHPTPIVQVQDLNAYMYHANETNKFSVGIEINGLFPGLIKDFKAGNHTAEGPTPSQISNTRLAVQWICDEVEAKGGKISHIIPHRCSNTSRRSDPGELAWREIGVWAQQNLGLTDKGPGWTIGDGKPIPAEWDNRPAYAKYKY